eukprot:CAMPEP_0206141444 /NCGR_PEP_ID=MMETSP1473-20131121/12936_1 /ASSEMBLY_ACC=CAM_ASM_001109 /TAXON_ID=1461547 /ORGANISM="Stichococcus sp, Strain RCC1054" /LENGTH=236 /DNA_ID=CAMNT_0053536021 /DNA_START=463 /DNA_END=1170 /DNA_ORIENTATION=-
MAADERDEQYLLRVQDKALAERLTRLLRDDPAQRPSDAEIELNFEGDHSGTLTVGGDVFPMHIKNLPTLVESYKTYDDVHIVKSNDIGQMVVVGPPGAQTPPGDEARDGVTPAMRNARARHFRPPVDVPPNVVAQVEADLLTVLNGGAPDDVEFVDVEEEYVVDENGHGSWQPALPVAKVPVPRGGGKKKPGPKKQGGGQAGKKREPGPRSKKAKAAAAAATAAAPAATTAAPAAP